MDAGHIEESAAGEFAEESARELELRWEWAWVPGRCQQLADDIRVDVVDDWIELQQVEG